jgi:hypothetical protein
VPPFCRLPVLENEKEVVMKRMYLALIVLGTFCMAMTLTVSGVAAGPVEYTWTLAALGQGGWIGGPMFEGGSVGGGGALSVNNGQLVARFHPTTWTEDAEDLITVCFDVTIIKGPADALPPTLCVGPAEVTGTAVKIDIFGSEHVFRITENH